MISFQKLNESHLQQVLEWRTSEHVTKYMYTDIEYNLDNQKEWYKRVIEDKTQAYWIVKYSDTNIGLISLNNIDEKNKKTSFGYYIGDLDYVKIAGRIQPYLYNYVFFGLKLNKIYAEVIAENENMIKMHQFYGFTHQGTFKDHIYKYNQFHDVEYYELHADTWKEKMKKCHRFTANFDIS